MELRRRAPLIRPRCKRLLRDGGDLLLARKGARAHTHVLWLGLLAFVCLLTQALALGWLLAPTLLLFGALAAIALFDLRYLLIPDGPVLLLLVAGAATAFAQAPSLLPERLLAAGGAYALLAFAALAYRRLRGVEGLGLGDAKLFALAGLWLGFPALPGCLLTAALSGLVSALILLREKGPAHAREAVPFGPHLALALWLAWSVGPLEFR